MYRAIASKSCLVASVRRQHKQTVAGGSSVLLHAVVDVNIRIEFLSAYIKTHNEHR